MASIEQFGWNNERDTSDQSKERRQREARQSSLQGDAVKIAMQDAPENIWLNLGDTDLKESGWAWNDQLGVTWCEDRIDAGDIPYIRADLALALPVSNEVKAYIARLENALGLLDWIYASRLKDLLVSKPKI